MYRPLALLTLIVVLYACGSEQTKSPPPDVSAVEIDYTLHRFDTSLAALSDSEDVKTDVANMYGQYGFFAELFFERVLPIRGADDDAFVENLQGFLTDSRIERLVDTTAIVFADMEPVVEALDDAFTYYKYYVPSADIPDVYTFISEYSNQVFIFPDGEKDGIGIGLDMFLGRDFPYTIMASTNPAFSSYLSRTFDKEHLPRKVMDVILSDRLSTAPGNRLLDHMIHNGKKLYMLEKVLPTTPDSIVMEYTGDQTEWAKINELEMWSFFLDEDLLYETNMMKINKYINQSPNSPGMPAEAPGRTANYMGWQIVRAYMERFPNTSFDELIAIADAQQLMDNSRYRPKRK